MDVEVPPASKASRTLILTYHHRSSGRTDQFVSRLRPLVLYQDTFDKLRFGRQYFALCSVLVADILVSTNLPSASNSVCEVIWHVICPMTIADVEFRYQHKHTSYRQTSKRRNIVVLDDVGLSSYYRLAPWNYAISSPKEKMSGREQSKSRRMNRDQELGQSYRAGRANEMKMTMGLWGSAMNIHVQ